MNKNLSILVAALVILIIGVTGCGSGVLPNPTDAITTPTTDTSRPAVLPPGVTPTMATLLPPAAAPRDMQAPQPAGPVGAPLNLKQISRQLSELRAAWVHDNSIATAPKIDAIVDRAAQGHVNIIVANVFDQGMALYDSQFVNKHSEVAANFNPLAYLVDQAHRRNIQVYAWFVNGPVEFMGQSQIIAQHSDWAIVGPDGKTMAWLNFTRPDVRLFIGDLMWETVTRYGVDGLFFDFTRYPGPEWGFDAYSIASFNSSHDFNLEQLRYPDLPAYGYFEGNQVLRPTTAQVLATFSDGSPALTLNKYKQGQVIVFNWRASGREIAADSEIMRRSIRELLRDGGQVYSFRPDGKPDDNVAQSLEDTRNWLRDLGWPVKEIGTSEVKNLDANSVLIVSYGYGISAEAAAYIESFVAQGGGLVFIDGPVRSMSLATVRALTGMETRGKHIQEFTFLVARGDSSLLPSSSRGADLAAAQARDAQWKEFRKQGINDLIQGIYQRVKGQYPQVDISVTVTSDQVGASQLTLQDWQAWLEGGYIDSLVPRGYVEFANDLNPILAAWGPVMQQYKRVTLGVSTFSGKHNQRDPKSPSQLQDEINRASHAGSDGIMLWNLDYVDADQLKMLASGPFH